MAILACPEIIQHVRTATKTVAVAVRKSNILTVRTAYQLLPEAARPPHNVQQLHIQEVGLEHQMVVIAPVRRLEHRTKRPAVVARKYSSDLIRHF